MLVKELARQHRANESYGDFCEQFSGDCGPSGGRGMPLCRDYGKTIVPERSMRAELATWHVRDIPESYQSTLQFSHTHTHTGVYPMGEGRVGGGVHRTPVGFNLSDAALAILDCCALPIGPYMCLSRNHSGCIALPMSLPNPNIYWY